MVIPEPPADLVSLPPAPWTAWCALYVTLRSTHFPDIRHEMYFDKLLYRCRFGVKMSEAVGGPAGVDVFVGFASFVACVALDAVLHQVQ